jgi:CDP-4-dehydro-6-deoxyglucose reductase
MSYTITLQPSGHTFTGEEGETVLAAAMRHSIALPYNCRNGECGSCKAKLILGKVGYAGGQPEALSRQEQQLGMALLCQALPLSDLEIETREVRAAADIQPRTLPCRVEKLLPLCHDVMAIFLKLPQTERLQFLAGQYLDILCKDGRRRGFSIANAPHNDDYIELQVRNVEGGEFTHFVFCELKEKAMLRIEAPLGTFFLREDSPRPIIMMAGGTGFAPLKGMLEHAFHVGVQRPMHLYWGVRARRDLYQDALPRAWAAQHDNFTYTPVLSETAPSDHWQGETGWVHDIVAREYPDLSAYDVYMSGPPVMIRAAREKFLAQGLPESQLYHDAFEFAPR